MGHKSFGPAWPTKNPNIVVLTRADGLRLPIHRELVDMVSILMDLTEMMGYDILPGQTWGYANRPISGTNKPSNHSQGAAQDTNAPSNPYASAAWHDRNANAVIFGKRRRTDIPEAVFQMWKDNGWTLGVEYTSKPDPMHFEWLGSVDEARAQAAALRAFLAGNGQAAPPVPQPPPPAIPPPQLPIGHLAWPVMNRATRRGVGLEHEINIVQQVTGARVDGDFGPGTADAVRAYQAAHGQRADGVVDADTGTLIIQNGLRDMGFYGGRLDGDYGRGTTNAVAGLQALGGIRVDGVFGSDASAVMWFLIPK